MERWTRPTTFFGKKWFKDNSGNSAKVVVDKAENRCATAHSLRRSFGPDQHDGTRRIASRDSQTRCYNLLKQRSGTTNGYVDSLAASGASIVLMGCTTVTMLRGSWMMIHGTQGSFNGSRNASEFQRAADRMKAHDQQLFDIYRARWNGTDQELRDALDDELWLDEKDAVQMGLADRIADEVALAAHIDQHKFKFRNMPETLMLSASAHRDAIQLRRQLVELGLHRLI
jgi:hypothetical protein